MRERNKFNYFTVFIFLAIIFFANTDTVFAKVGGASFEAASKNTTFTPVEDLQQQGDEFCKIYASSNYVHKEQEQFYLGWAADIMANDKDFYENNAQDGTVAWSVFNNLVAYPGIIMFEERWKQQNGSYAYKRSTGYLYLYADSYYVKEQAAIWASYANTDADSYLPLYYQDDTSGKNEQGEAFFGLNGHMVYLPLSNIKSPSGSYYAQNFTTQSQADVRADAVAVLEKIMTEGDSKQDVNGWQSWNDDTPFLMGNLLTDEVKPISSKYKWVTMFAIGAMGENTYDNIGGNFTKGYKVKQGNLKEGFEGLAAELGVSIKDPVFKNMITGYYTSIPKGGYCGLKDNGQKNGIDTVYFSHLMPQTVLDVTAGKGISRLYVGGHDGHNLINGEKLLNTAYENVLKDKGYNVLSKNRSRLTPGRMLEAYNTVLAQAEDLGVDAYFINVPGVGNFLSRYSWGATVGKIAACQDTWFPRDGNPDTSKNPSSIIANHIFKDDCYYTKLKTNTYTKNFGWDASDNWGKLSEPEQIVNSIILLESHPWYVPLVSKKAYGRNLSVPELNALGADKKTYAEWKKAVTLLGEYIVKNSVTSVFPARGWSAQSAFADNGGYAVQTYPIFLALTSPPSYTEDLLISNSYSKAEDSSIKGGAAGTTHNPTARKTIDWGNGSVSSTDLNTILAFSGYGTGLTGQQMLKSAGQSSSNEYDYKDSNYDIRIGLNNMLNLITFKDNIAQIPKGTNPKAAQYLANPQAFPFTSIFFVGRIPEADGTNDVNLLIYKQLQVW